MDDKVKIPEEQLNKVQDIYAWIIAKGLMKDLLK